MTKKQKIKNILIMSILMLVLALSCIFYKQINSFSIDVLNKEFNVVFARNNLMVHFINVGQGDAIAINLPNNEILLIDTGPSKSNVAYTTYLKEKVLNTKFNKSIDYLILTHADSDHCAGTMKLLNEFDVEKIYMPIVDSETATYTELKEYIQNNCNSEVVSRELNVEIGGCEIDIMGLYNINDTNESSAVVKITHMNKSFLFMADISSETEEMLINEYGSRLDCDVLKVAHHGSAFSTSKEFLEVATPTYAIISVGTNSYGHPTQTVINNLNNANAKILRTDKDNNILIVVGNHYNCAVKTYTYYVSGFYMEYRIFVLVVDLTMLTLIIITIFKRPRNKHINI